jgi:site-specific DNA-methyltransferase (cytosine-N4-specific)
VKPYYDGRALLLTGDTLNVLKTRPSESVDCIVTSPPYYGLRDYGTEGQYGLEATPAAYVETMRAVFSEARRILADDGTLWLNLGDSFASSGISSGGLPAKNLMGMPWRTAFALQDDGWILRNEVIWHKSNAMPSSVQDRMSNKHEHLFLFAKTSKYWFDLDAIKVPASGHASAGGNHATYASSIGTEKAARVYGINAASTLHGPPPAMRNPGDVWSITTKPYPAAHFATFPIELPTRCIKAACKPNGVVLDPFSGSGTTGLAARQLGMRYIGIDLNPEYHNLAIERFAPYVNQADEEAS